jgi:hypothetical protein
MWVIFLILFFFVGWLVCGALSKFFRKLAGELTEREQQERYYKEQLLLSARQIANAVTPVTPKINPVDSLLEANRDLLDKKKVRDAMEKELGIPSNKNILNSH